MTLVGALARRSLEDPGKPISAANIVEWAWGRPATSVRVTEERAYGLSAYYRGIALLSSVMAQVPLKVYRNGTKERVRQSTVLDNPNPAQTPFEFRQTMLANAVAWGNAFAEKLYSRRTHMVAEVWPVHPSAVARVEAVKPTADNPAGKVFHMADGSTRTPRTLLHLPYLSPHGTEGIRPLLLARHVLGIPVAAEETSAGFYGNGARPSGLLTTEQKLSREQAESLQERWQSRYGGPQASGKVAVLDAGAKFMPLTLPPEDAQLLESRKFGVTEIARLLGIPPWMVGDVEKTTSWGTGIEQQFIAWITVTLQGWFTMVEQRFTRELLPGGWTSGQWYAEHAIEGMLRGDSAARASFYRTMREIGAMSINDIRVRENEQPLDTDIGDALMLPSNMTLIRSDGTIIPLTQDGAVDDAERAAMLAEIVQKIYLGVGVVLTAEEAREIVNQAGGDLTGALPPPAPAAS